jgi:choline dehydrogenase
MSCLGYALRPTSEGSATITSADPDAPLLLDPNYFTTEHDRVTTANLLRRTRELFAQSPIADRIDHETFPGTNVQSDDEIVDSALDGGYTGYHAIGSCAMGSSDDDVVDERLRVRGVDGLRVIDTSVMPIMVAGNLNGPMMAMAARASEFIIEDR